MHQYFPKISTSYHLWLDNFMLGSNGNTNELHPWLTYFKKIKCILVFLDDNLDQMTSKLRK